MITTFTVTSTKQGFGYDEAASVAAFSMLEGFARLTGNLLRIAISATAGFSVRPVQTAQA